MTSLIRGGVEERKLDVLMQFIVHFSLSRDCDRWRWNLEGLVVLTVSNTRNFIDSVMLPDCQVVTIWSLSRKRKGFSVAALLCPILFNAVETTNYVFISCEFIGSLWSKTFSWLNMVMSSWASIDDIFLGLIRFIFLWVIELLWRLSFLWSCGWFGILEWVAFGVKSLCRDVFFGSIVDFIYCWFVMSNNWYFLTKRFKWLYLLPVNA